MSQTSGRATDIGKLQDHDEKILILFCQQMIEKLIKKIRRHTRVLTVNYFGLIGAGEHHS